LLKKSSPKSKRKKRGNMLVREYHPDKELLCPCGCGAKSPREAVEMLYAVRIIMGIPLIITSSVRCLLHNKDKKVGGSEFSTHLAPGVIKGRPRKMGAFDVVAESPEKHKLHEWRLIQVCQFVGLNGIGLKDNTFLHIDNRSEPTVWGYSK
jgi:hypothetical protein